MAKFIFDGDNKLIYGEASEVIAGVFSFSIYDLYSEWKRWMLLDDNLKYLPAFRTIGGDPIGAGQYVGFYLFLRNDYGWRLVPPDVDNLTVQVEGSLFGESPNLAIMNSIAGNTTSLIINRSALTTGVATSGSTFTPAEMAEAVWSKVI